ncbi:MAG: response regulator transcription factor [Pseudomonadota bacterium]|nr:response regulator transcription factor [Pseudomonadota bacterium]
MLLITQTGFKSTTWKTAFPDIELHTDNSFPSDLTSHQIIWLVSQIPNWQSWITELSSSGKLVIVLTRKASTEEFKLAFQSGAKGYVDALANPQILQTVYKSVNAGGLWIPENLINQMINIIATKIENENIPDLHELSAAEKLVAEKISLGESNKEIAEELKVCERTIKSHLTSIYQKLNLRDRMHLMLYMQGKIT